MKAKFKSVKVSLKLASVSTVPSDVSAFRSTKASQR
jgi:hypothetical protein